MTRRDRAEVAALLGVPESELGDYVPRFNIAPTQPYFVLKTRYESREANIIADEVIWAMETIWRTLNRLYQERFGRPYHQGHITLDGMREIFQRDLANMRGKGIVRK